MALPSTRCAVLLAALFSGFWNVSILGHKVIIPEDVPVGSTVVRLRDFVDVSEGLVEDGNGTVWSVNITGDEFGRFEVCTETLALVVAAPMDYELGPRYNLSLGLEMDSHAKNRSILYFSLNIIVTDVPGYPPFYDKRCEAPVLHSKENSESYILFSMERYYASLNGEAVGYYDDFISEWRDLANAPHVIANDDCSIRVFGFFQDLPEDGAFFRPLMEGPQNGKVEFQCHDKEWKKKGYVTFLGRSVNDTLPHLTQNDGLKQKETDGYVVVAEVSEIWSASPYWLRCGANITLFGGTNLFEYTYQFNVTGCPKGRFGLYCDKHCVCKNGARCHGFNGACKCCPGWRGRACDIPWPELVIIESPGDSVIQYIGTDLTLTCLVPHIEVANMTWVYQPGNANFNATIDEGAVTNSSINFQPILESANGRYTCMVQAQSGNCFVAAFVLNATKCPLNYYREVCNQVCDCQYGGTCDRWEGCLCPPGRHGDTCERICSPGTFGPNCSMNCYCQNNASCDAVNGSCMCGEGQSGEFCQSLHIRNSNQVVLEVLASVLPTIVIIACIVIAILVRRTRQHPRGAKYTKVVIESEMECLSSWELDKEDIRLEHMIGEGEFGHVVRGRLRLPEGYEVLVAAKSIRHDRMTGSAIRDFRREMSIFSRIHEEKDGHPYVVKFYGVVTMSDPQYIVVEYAGNEDLRRYLWTLREECKIRGMRKLSERLGFASDVASGLSELARLKIVHRDIAARNVVISERKVAKIADFGLSRDVYISSAYERTNQGGEEELLPLKWMAVESLRDGVYTCESDVWSYGVLLWEIASFGEEPRYPGPMHPDVCKMLELLRKGVRLQQPENCPMQLYKIIRSCWIVDPVKRPSPDELSRRINMLRPPKHAAHLVNHNIR